jgi:hypothetical protein
MTLRIDEEKEHVPILMCLLIFLGGLQEQEQPFARQEEKFGFLEQNVVDIKTSTP